MKQIIIAVVLSLLGYFFICAEGDSNLASQFFKIIGLACMACAVFSLGDLIFSFKKSKR